MALTLAAIPADSRGLAGTPGRDPQQITRPDRNKAKQAYQAGAAAEHTQNWQAAFEAYSAAAALAPGNHQYALRRETARSRAVQAKMDAAERDAVSGRLDQARKEMMAAHYLDPSDTTVTERMAELGNAAPEPAAQGPREFEPSGEVHLETTPGKHSFNFRGTTQEAYQEIARQFGVDTAFDVDMLSRQVRFRVDDVDFTTATAIVGDMTDTFWRPLTKHLFFVAQDTAAKRKQYDVSIVRTIVFPASETVDQMTEILRMVREIAGITRTELDSRTRTLTLRAGPRAVAIASDLVENLEKPLGQLVLEIEILEVDRTYARQLGLTPPQTGKIYTLSSQQVQEAEASENGLISVIEQVFGTPSALSGLSPSQIAALLAAGQLGSFIPNVVSFGGGKTTFLTTPPGAAANFSEMLSLVKHGRRILLRAEDGQPATFFVGEKFPVSLAQFSPSLGGAGVDVAGVSSSSFPTANYATGNGPTFVTAASLRNNGIDDLIVTNFTDNTISVLLGNGDGTFQGQVSYDVGTAPEWIATGDFNKDGNVDLAVANQNANTLSILLGNGDGTFQPQTTIPTGNQPLSVIAANMHDADGNGNLDLVVANHGDSTISIFQGNGDGTFQTPATLTTLPKGYAPSSLAESDFNSDGHIDLAVTEQGNNSVSILLGKGDGTFQQRTDYPVGNSPVWVSTGDLNADGIIDLAVANNGPPTNTLSGDSVSILLGQTNSTNTTTIVGTGAFGSQVAYAAGNSPTSIAIADFNEDGLADLAVAAETDNSLALLLGQGPGTFGPFFELPVGTDPLALVTEDFNADGRSDLAIANNGSNTITVISNSANLTAANGLAGTQFPNSQYIDIGLKVKATPRLHQPDDVTLQLNFEISSLASASFNGIPVINNQAIEQTVRLKENETSVLAGILQSQIGNAIDGTPGIANIPGIGGLLGDQNVQDQDNELLVLITPRMVLLAPRKDREIYAGQGAPEGLGAFGPGRELREGLPLRVEPPPQTEQPQQEPQPQTQPPGSPPQPAPAQPQPQPQGQPPQQQPQPQNQPQP